MEALRNIALVIAGVIVAAVFLLVALLVLGVVIWVLAAAADSLARLSTEPPPTADSPPQ